MDIGRSAIASGFRFTDSPADGTPELGQAFLSVAVDKVAADLAAFYASASTW
jgi:hypothetical protein